MQQHRLWSDEGNAQVNLSFLWAQSKVVIFILYVISREVGNPWQALILLGEAVGGEVDNTEIVMTFFMDYRDK